MATCAENKVTADAFVVTLYPEITNITTFMDSLATLGRLVFVVTLEDPDHGPALEDKLNADLTGLGYSVTRKESTVTIACA